MLFNKKYIYILYVVAVTILLWSPWHFCANFITEYIFDVWFWSYHMIIWNIQINVDAHIQKLYHGFIPPPIQSTINCLKSLTYRNFCGSSLM